jgi:hypothetical protein
LVDLFETGDLAHDMVVLLKLAFLAPAQASLILESHPLSLQLDEADLNNISNFGAHFL